jgi:hypothetical protein
MSETVQSPEEHRQVIRLECLRIVAEIGEAGRMAPADLPLNAAILERYVTTGEVPILLANYPNDETVKGLGLKTLRLEGGE